MDIEVLRSICLSLPGTSEDIKWGNDLCFLVAGKMFCVTGLSGEFGASLKVPDEEFEVLSQSPGIIPAPYMARNKWIYIQNAGRFSQKEWEHYIKQSYELVKAKLPRKVRESL